jgi:hypothetical protein
MVLSDVLNRVLNIFTPTETVETKTSNVTTGWTIIKLFKLLTEQLKIKMLFFKRVIEPELSNGLSP